jgi:hypothetical protein
MAVIMKTGIRTILLFLTFPLFCLAQGQIVTNSPPAQHQKPTHLRQPTPQELEEAKAQGIDTNGLMVDDSTRVGPSQTPKSKRLNLSKEDLEFLKQKGIDTNDIIEVRQENQKTATPADLKNAVIWMDSFMGVTNAVIPADVITIKKDSLRFRLDGRDYDYSGHFTVMLQTPRKHKKPHFGFSSPDTAKFVILENIGSESFPLQDATVWEKSTGFIDVEAAGMEWIHSGMFTVQN